MPPGTLTLNDGDYSATVETVLSALDRWTARNDGHHTEKRSSRRFALRAPVNVVTRHSGNGLAVRIDAHTRNISVSGLAFVVPKRIQFAALGGEVLTATSLFTPDTTIAVSLDRDGHAIRLIAKICRLRKVHDDLYECGVMFVGRQEDVPPPPEIAAEALETPALDEAEELALAPPCV
jgi:hypothetical protein